jgi:hopanoid biosynthesis associated protein HpnK
LNRLAITADDFGLSEPVNAAVEEAHRRGILSAASLMVGAPAAADAIRRARALPGLRVGLHVVLVNDDPMTPRAQIPALVDASGRLRNDLVGYSVRSVIAPSVRRQISAEITAQFEAYRATGLPLDHVNAHRHFHLNPVVAAAIVGIGRRYGMRALRVPVEPWRIVADIDPQTHRLAARVVAPWATWLRAQIRRAGLITADAVFGLAWSGAMTKSRVAALLGRLPPGFVEIYYADEFAALCDADCIAAARRSGYAIGGYADAGN